MSVPIYLSIYLCQFLYIYVHIYVCICLCVFQSISIPASLFLSLSLSIYIYSVTNRLSLGLRKQARNENKKYIYKITRMSQGSIKKRVNYGKGISPI